MDKNMIHIDDLVRQRLGGGQEPERPGAWLTMRELLDKEMPAAVATGTNWRRVFGYFTGLLLLTTASVGSYKLYNRNAAHSGTGGGSIAESSSVPHSTASHSTGAPVSNIGMEGTRPLSLPATADKSNATHSSIAAANRTHSSSTSSSNSNHSIHSAGNTHHVAANNAGADQNNNNNNNNTNTSAGTTLAQSGKPLNKVAASDVNTTSADRNTRASAASPTLLASANNPVSAASNAAYASTVKQPVALAATNTTNNKKVYASSANVSVHGRRTAANATRVQSADARMMPASSFTPAATQAVRTLPAPEQTRLVRRDTIEAIELVGRRVYDAGTQKSVFRIDTFPKGKIVIDRIVPQPELVADNSLPVRQEKHRLSLRHPKQATAINEKAAAVAPMGNAAVAASGDMKTQQATQTLPAAKSATTAQADAAANEHLVSLSNSKVSGRHFSLWNAEKVDAAINKFKFNLARIQMYPGLIGGINASIFTPNALGGFQVGLTSLFVLNDWWTLMTELKYLHRFNTGSTVRDDYMNVVSGTTSFTTGPNNQPYKSYVWQDEHVDHYFNYEVIKTFELPLALRYNSGRFYTQGGVNLVYSTKIDAREVTNPRGDVASHNKLLPATHDDEPFITNVAPLVKLTDFGARFGTGYILGGGFMFTPAVYLDLRVTQTFWDNANSYGSRQISKDLLRTPSFQISLGYRFSTTHNKD